MSSSSSQRKTLQIGIIGFGPFAQFLAKTMMKQGNFIRVTSRSDYSELCTNLGILFFRDMGAFLESDNEVIMISTSILSLSRVVESIPFHCLKRPTLFVDVLPEECDLLCTHPMFGPESGKDGWTDLTFMYDMVRIRDQPLSSSFLHIFSSEGCRMLEMTCEEHDRLAAQSQFLTHTIGRILSEMEVEPTPIDTKGFQKLVQVKESSVKDSFDLFSGLFIHNRFARQQMKNLQVALEKTKEKLQERSKELQDPIISKF
ncbi:arogenate dehydrogenase 1, chloroplastic-like isoform X2 [Solanum dulcamara]|uniref:arogenate dehydrogenase 1, chloroplastic-like isoform X2 n=1 Tax=Solanum dulcamara TaxID=45834 RepID=UPI002485554F|nr:arogenate dehydrogenase 1, chloroplastic-like isoform X2 [Solanum dulcamara]